MEDMTVALPGGASYPILVHRLTFDPPRLPIPYSVALMHCAYTSLVVINLRGDLHLLEWAHVGRAK
jgi:hypothetical protein